jgi:hypothetical protein
LFLRIDNREDEEPPIPSSYVERKSRKQKILCSVFFSFVRIWIPTTTMCANTKPATTTTTTKLQEPQQQQQITHILNITTTIIREEEEETKNCPTHQQQQHLNCVALCEELRFNSPP